MYSVQFTPNTPRLHTSDTFLPTSTHTHTHTHTHAQVSALKLKFLSSNCSKNLSHLTPRIENVTTCNVVYGSALLQHVPSLKFMWSLQYMFSKIWKNNFSHSSLCLIKFSVGNR